MSEIVQRPLLEQLEDPCEDVVRQTWRHLVGVRLPRAALERNWPVTADHCFARILLDVTLERPWRDVVKPPAWRHMPICQMETAISLGEALLSNEQNIDDLNKQSLSLRRLHGSKHQASRLDAKANMTSRKQV
ncbi:MAG: hypothetical protein AAGA73_06580 [Pseudomonadota bacterium]